MNNKSYAVTGLRHGREKKRKKWLETTVSDCHRNVESSLQILESRKSSENRLSFYLGSFTPITSLSKENENSFRVMTHVTV